MYITLIVFASVILLIIYFYTIIKNHDYWGKYKVPCASGVVPGFGHVLPLLLLRENFGALISRLYREMGNRSMYGCYIMQTPALVIRDPELLRTVLQSNFSSFCNNILAVQDDLDPIMSKNPFFAKNEVWRKSRIMLSNNFSVQKMRFIFANTMQACENFINYIDKKIEEQDNNPEFESRDIFSRVFGEIVANCAFGIDGQSFEDKPDPRSFTSVASRFFEPTLINGLRQTIRFFLPRLADQIGVKFVSDEMDAFIRHNLGAFVNSVLKNEQATNDDCFQFPIKENNIIEDNMTIAQATSLLFDGYEACTNVLSFMMYWLAENTEIQDKARREVDCVLNEFGGKMTYEAVKKLKYLDLVIQETLRMHPVFGDLSRVCNEKIELRGSDGLACELKSGDMVLISVESLHMDEEFWPNPLVFDPERFNSENKATRNRYTFLGFSEGMRLCPGKRMGTMMVKAIAAKILLRYSLKMSMRSQGPLKLNPNSFASVVEGGLWIRFKQLQ